MKIDDYRLLITLDETKTLRKAAEILYISQPAVTQRLKAIESSFELKYLYVQRNNLSQQPKVL